MSIQPDNPWAVTQAHPRPDVAKPRKRGFEYWLTVASGITFGLNVLTYLFFASVSLGPQAYVYADNMQWLVLVLLAANFILGIANPINGIVILAQRRSPSLAMLRMTGGALLAFTGFWAIVAAAMSTWTF